MDNLLKTSTYKNILAFVDQHELLPPGTPIIIGLSGGPDSVFLLHFLHTLRPLRELHLTAVHIDHQWRADSAQDTIWCEQLCKQLNIDFVSTTITNIEYEPRHRGSQEDYARAKRRYFFQQIAQQKTNARIALAHHKDDQMETFFIRLLRGSSLSGLVSMRAHDGLYIRPLLAITKQEILNFLHEHTLDYRIDSTNESAEFLRNRIRNIGLPALRVCDSRFDQTFFTTFARLEQTEAFLQKLAEQTFQELLLEKTENTLDYQALLQLDKVLQYRILMLWFIAAHVPFEPSQALLDETLRFLENGKQPHHQIHHLWFISKKKNTAIIEHSIANM